MKRAFVIALIACGPGPTEANAPSVAPISTTNVTPTKQIHVGPDCNTKAMVKLTATITDAGTSADLDASVAQEEASPADATLVLQKAAALLTACNPSELEGCAFFTTSVETDGTVSAVEPFVSDALPRDVLECLMGVLKGARFAAVPKAGKMTVPVTFTRTR
jgi:hypothetical protein